MFNTFNRFRFHSRAGFVAATLALVAQTAFAAYPDKPISLVVPFAPGGGTDLIARTPAAGLSDDRGQQVIIDNKPGAGTIIGSNSVAESAAESAADSYAIVSATFAHAVNPSLVPKLPFAADEAFAPITLIGRGPNVLLVRAGSPFTTVKDIIAAAKTKPGSWTCASQGNDTSAHLAAEIFTNLAKVEMPHVPYRGAGPAITDLLGGQLDMNPARLRRWP